MSIIIYFLLFIGILCILIGISTNNNENTNNENTNNENTNNENINNENINMVENFSDKISYNITKNKNKKTNRKAINNNSRRYDFLEKSSYSRI